jgi:hypothetical protein
MTANHTASGWFSSPEGISAAWFGVLAGPIAWAADLGVGYALVKWTCGHQHVFVLRLASVTALIVIAAGAFSAWRTLDRSDSAAAGESSIRIDRGRFMAMWGLLSCAFFALVVIATAIPRWVLDACQ